MTGWRHTQPAARWMPGHRRARSWPAAYANSAGGLLASARKKRMRTARLANGSTLAASQAELPQHGIQATCVACHLFEQHLN